MSYKYRKNNGLSTIELVIALAVMGLIFTSLVASVLYSIKVAGVNKARLGALAILDEEFEKARAIPYANLGVSGTLVPGILSDSDTVSFNNINYHVIRKVFWVDDPKDGTGALDSDGNTRDYKQLKIIVTWTFHDKNYSESAVSNFFK